MNDDRRKWNSVIKVKWHFSLDCQFKINDDAAKIRILILRSAHDVTSVLLLSDLVNIKISLPSASVIKHNDEAGWMFNEITDISSIGYARK